MAALPDLGPGPEESDYSTEDEDEEDDEPLYQRTAYQVGLALFRL